MNLKCLQRLVYIEKKKRNKICRAQMHRSSQQMEKGECFVLIEDTVYNARNLSKLFHYFMKEKTVLRHTEKKIKIQISNSYSRILCASIYQLQNKTHKIKLKYIQQWSLFFERAVLVKLFTAGFCDASVYTFGLSRPKNAICDIIVICNTSIVYFCNN